MVLALLLVQFGVNCLSLSQAAFVSILARFATIPQELATALLLTTVTRRHMLEAEETRSDHAKGGRS